MENNNNDNNATGNGQRQPKERKIIRKQLAVDIEQCM